MFPYRCSSAKVRTDTRRPFSSGAQSLLFAILFALAYSPQSVFGQVPKVACLPGHIQADAGKLWRWPIPNPGMVAPVALQWSYPKYKNPLPLEYTGKSLAINMPLSYTGGFNLSTPGKPADTDESYSLSRIELRKPPAIPEGAGQVLTHQWEMVLIHKEAKGVYWANVVVPFAVTTSGSALDIVNPLIEGADLPTVVGNIVPVMAASTSHLYLDPVFVSTDLLNTTFHHVWSEASCAGCEEKSVPTRTFLRSSPLGIGMDSAQQLARALIDVKGEKPTMSYGMDFWIVDPCKKDDECEIHEAADLANMAKNAHEVQSSAVEEQRKCKTKLDGLLSGLRKHIGAANETSIAMYQEAVAAQVALKSAVAQLNTAENTFSKVTGWKKQAELAKWEYQPKSMPAAMPSDDQATMKGKSTETAKEDDESMANTGPTVEAKGSNPMDTIPTNTSKGPKASMLSKGRSTATVKKDSDSSSSSSGQSAELAAGQRSNAPLDDEVSLWQAWEVAPLGAGQAALAETKTQTNTYEEGQGDSTMQESFGDDLGMQVQMSSQGHPQVQGTRRFRGRRRLRL